MAKRKGRMEVITSMPVLRGLGHISVVSKFFPKEEKSQNSYVAL